MELIKKHEEFEKRMNANDDKINQMMHFAQRLNEENHYASDKIMEKAHSIDKRWASQLFLFLTLWFYFSFCWPLDSSRLLMNLDKTRILYFVKCLIGELTTTTRWQLL